MDKIAMRAQVNFEWIKENYFSDADKMLHLKKGEILLDFRQKNTRLFLVLKGKFFGYIKDVNLEHFPVFEATKDKFIGVYSYFSDDNLSYSRVVAEEDSCVVYYDKPLLEHSLEEYDMLMPFLNSVVVNELYSRQHFAKKMAKEKHDSIEKLLKAEKMATLGQMAAGLAHELNNAIGVLNSNLSQLSGFAEKCISNQQEAALLHVFKEGLAKGQFISSEEARNNRTKYQDKIKGLSSAQIRHLSKTGISAELIKDLIHSNPKLVDNLYECWEAGCALHDMDIAARHSTHVVKSVKQLGVAEHQWAKDVDINQTIKEALAIVKTLTRRVETTIELGELPETEACGGELIQVWINLIKNAVESMIQSEMKNPKLLVKSELGENEIVVTIKDNGPGIPEAIKEKIFEPSFTTKVGGLSFGLGLGLTIVQRIITEHAGVIALASEAGKTEFKIKLPLN